MAGTHKSILVVLLFVFVAAVGGTGAFFFFGPGAGRGESEVVRPTGAGAGTQIRAAPEPGPELESIPEPVRNALRTGESSVAWPVEVHLELVSPANLPRAGDGESVALLGSGRLASVKGRIASASGQPVAATIAFVAGPNEGRELRCHSDGRFGAIDLYPGLSLVRVSGPGIPGSLRELRLRRHKTSELTIGYGLPGGLAGTVYDEAGEPLPDVRVELEGRYATTDEEGAFFLDGIASGLDLALTLSKPGYAHYSQRVSIAQRFTLSDQKYRMQPAASLLVTAPNAVGGPGLAQVVLLPEDPNQGRDYPWHKINPVLVKPGSSVVIDELPPKRIKLRIFHEGARAKPKVQVASLVSGRQTTVELGLEAAPAVTGVITDPQGRVVPNAFVRLEAPDRVAAALAFLGEMPSFLETEIMPTLPVSVQEGRANAQGRFVFSAWSELAPTRYLIAESSDKLFAGARFVRAGDAEITLQLAPVDEGRGALSVRFPDRWQGLPVEHFVQGEPRGLTLLEADQGLEIEDLAEGTWRLSARWHGRSILPEPEYEEFEVVGKTIRELGLPRGAIDGQDPETLLRAGAPWAPEQ